MATRVVSSITTNNGLVTAGTSVDSTAGGQTLYNDAGTLKFVDLVDSPRLQWTYTSGTNNLSADLFNYSITDTQLRYGTGTSVIGRSASGSGPVADIAASANGQVLVRDAGALVFRALAAGDVSGVQPLDGDLTAIAALTGTNTIYYRSAADTWTAVTIGTGLAFTGGSLSATGGGGGTTIQSGAGAPTATTGSAGDYYEDTTDDVLYGPKGTPGSEERITVASAPANNQTNNEHGVQVKFTQGGVITRLRYQRLSTSAGTLNLSVWNDDTGGTLITTVSDTQSTTGAFEVILAVPLAVAAGATRTFSMSGAGGQVPYRNTSTTVTSTAHCTWLAFRNRIGNVVYPNTTTTLNGYYVEPVFEPDNAWPIAVRQIPGFTSTTPGMVPLSGGGTANFLRADGTWNIPAGTVTGVTDTATIDLTLSAGSLSGIVIDNSITDVKLRTGVAASVIGRSSTTTGNVADIQATADGVVLTRNAGTLSFSKLLAAYLDGTRVSVYQASNLSLTASTFTPVHLDTETEDTLGEFNVTDWSFTPAATGVYLIDLRITVSGNPASTRVICGIYTKTPFVEVKRLSDGEAGFGGNLCLVTLTAATAYQFVIWSAGASSNATGGASLTNVIIRRHY